MGLGQNLAVGGAVIGSLIVWRRVRGHGPQGERRGETVTRLGVDAVERTARLIEGTGRMMTNTAAAAVRATGGLTAKGIGGSLTTVGSIASKAIPHRKAPPASDMSTTGEPAAVKVEVADGPTAGAIKRKTTRPRRAATASNG